MRRLLLAPALAVLLLTTVGPPAASAQRLPCLSVPGVLKCPSKADPTPPPVRSCAGQDTEPSRTTVGRARTATLCLLNRERAERGMRPLRSSRPLRTAAVRFARHMVRADFFSHVSPAGDTLGDRVKRTSYIGRRTRRWSLGENIAFGTGDRSTPESIVRSWMESPGHRRNILRRSFRHIGLGIALGAPGAGSAGATYVTDFGTRR